MDRLAPGVGDRRRLAASLGAWFALLVVTVAVLLPFRSDANVGVIVLLMLLPPLAATGTGPLIAAGAALVSGLVFNFCFTHPYDSPDVASNASVTALVVYVIVATALALVASQLRDARALANQRAREATQLQRLTVDMISTERLGPVLEEALAGLVEALGLRGARLAVAAGEPIEAAVGAPIAGGRSFPIATLDAELGELVVDPGDAPFGPDRERVARSFAGIVALAAARARLAEEGARRRVLEETDRVRTILLQSVSHDLRTPLTAIKAAASALRTAPPARRQADRMLADVEEQADRLARLVANLLDLSRLESGSLRLQRELIPVDELVTGAVEAARPATGGAAVTVDVAADVPPVAVDETMIRQVLVNLLANAARADRSGRLGITVRAGAGEVTIAVSDHGPGIAAAERERLFEPYAGTRPGSGSAGAGVGLAIARGFVDAHGGSIAVAETPGGGATFVVSLPLGEDR